MSRWLYSLDLASYLDCAGGEYEAGVGRGHGDQQGRVCGDGEDDGVVSLRGELTKHSTNIDMELEKVLTVVSLMAYRDSRRIPARISRDNFARLASGWCWKVNCKSRG